MRRFADWSGNLANRSRSSRNTGVSGRGTPSPIGTRIEAKNFEWGRAFRPTMMFAACVNSDTACITQAMSTSASPRVPVTSTWNPAVPSVSSLRNANPATPRFFAAREQESSRSPARL